MFECYAVPSSRQIEKKKSFVPIIPSLYDSLLGTSIFSCKEDSSIDQYASSLHWLGDFTSQYLEYGFPHDVFVTESQWGLRIIKIFIF